mmetsp:Transcript_27053/g.64249  ORF Transcript_27053/g.64249 Transcript_27053/m.64249 type:complete len:301 (-) Transcript_27053:3384-4286(-)
MHVAESGAKVGGEGGDVGCSHKQRARRRALGTERVGRENPEVQLVPRGQLSGDRRARSDTEVEPAAPRLVLERVRDRRVALSVRPLRSREGERSAESFASGWRDRDQTTRGSGVGHEHALGPTGAATVCGSEAARVSCPLSEGVLLQGERTGGRRRSRDHHATDIGRGSPSVRERRGTSVGGCTGGQDHTLVGGNKADDRSHHDSRGVADNDIILGLAFSCACLRRARLGDGGLVAVDVANGEGAAVNGKGAGRAGGLRRAGRETGRVRRGESARPRRRERARSTGAKCSAVRIVDFSLD